ncbi:sugar transferase [Pseudogemmobacter faecipullorum]|uniref:Sugar transferase n=1 Tax=Pseudogemmobacter faecipullorum TaxID=2755041 RepID=A0ABS8CN73_9RHOB|nr:sugar transferase [Pseudogemmobacter faecipullorum]MCB5410828.1 sugar transferase [Pseudogemmobacter faecipullorum]
MKQVAGGIKLPGRAQAAPAPLRQETGFYQRGGKRGLDLLLVTASLPVALPLIAFFALLIALQGGAPFYGHWRLGRGGRAFRCWKLRSMVRDADAQLARYLRDHPAAQQEWERGFKLEHDPRITGIGLILRRSSLDELPQIFNILRGDMSCVGPRPVTRAETRFYGAELALCQGMRPGLTGLWQVSGRSGLSYDARVALDLRYVRNCSARLDLQIILRTFGAMLTASGR